jgi:hypothetical protein
MMPLLGRDRLRFAQPAILSRLVWNPNRSTRVKIVRLPVRYEFPNLASFKDSSPETGLTFWSEQRAPAFLLSALSKLTCYVALQDPAKCKKCPSGKGFY